MGKNKHSNMLRDTGDWLLIDPTLELKNEAQPAQFVAGRRRRAQKTIAVNEQPELDLTEVDDFVLVDGDLDDCDFSDCTDTQELQRNHYPKSDQMNALKLEAKFEARRKPIKQRERRGPSMRRAHSIHQPRR